MKKKKTVGLKKTKFNFSQIVVCEMPQKPKECHQKLKKKVASLKNPSKQKIHSSLAMKH